MSDLEIKIKKLHPDAILPKQANASDAGYDLVAIDDGTVGPEGYLQYRTGLAIQPPDGYHTEIVPRSSISKYDLALANSLGIIDNIYRGELLIRFKYCVPFSHPNTKLALSRRYKKGDKIAQLIIRKTELAVFKEVTELSTTDRGANGFGSSGN